MTYQGRIQGGLWGLETPFQSVSYSKVSTSINYFIGAIIIINGLAYNNINSQSSVI